MKANDASSKDGFRPRPHYFALIWVWVSVVATTLLYLLFLSLESWRPHVIWWIITTAIIAAGFLFASWLVVRCLIGRKQQTWAIAMFMLTILPLVWFTSLFWATVASVGGPAGLELNLPFRGLAIWTGSYYELEARWRYPRITDGKHVQLFDDGQTPDVQQIVAEMDQHIESMAQTLGQPIAQTKTRWVRGPVSGLSANSLGAWAVCRPSRAPNLQYVDLHEVAHSVITMMCPIDQEMPMLLAEGWAQSNSKDRADTILALYRRHKDGETPTLVQITNDAYGKSDPDAYDIGAPLAWYLLEAFGGEKFHELYGGVKRDHFEADVLRILGVTWQQVDQDFWKWLAQQAEIEIENRNAHGESQSAVSFDRPQDQARWEQIVSEIKEREKRGFPERFAINCSGENYGGQLVIAPHAIWTSWKVRGSNPSQTFEWLTAERCDSVLQMSDERFDFHPDVVGTRHFTVELNSIKHWWLEKGSLKNVLRLDSWEPWLKNNNRHRIHSISEGANISAPWTINYSTFAAEADVPKRRGVMKVDPQHAFDLISSREDSNNGEFHEHFYEYGDMDGHRIAQRIVSNDKSKKQNVWTIAEMSPLEIDKTKQATEAAVLEARARSKTIFPSNLKSALMSPKALAFGWPLMTLMVFGIDWLGSIKFRVRKTQ